MILLCRLCDLFNSGDSVPPAVPDQLGASLDEAFLLLALLVVDKLAFHLNKVFPSLTGRLKAVSLLVIRSVWIRFSLLGDRVEK